MSHIFISYSRQDIDFARYVRASLESQGFYVWMDEKRLSAGMDWWDEIEHNIDSCAAFLVLMSPDSRESVFVRNEILRALDQKRPLFPILYRGKHFGMLAHAHYEDMRGGLNDSFSDDFCNRLHDATGMGSKRTVRFEVMHNAIESVEADVLLLKDSPGAGGVASIIMKSLRKANIMIPSEAMSEVGDYHMVKSNGTLKADHTLFVRTEWVGHFGYRQVRQFANRGLSVTGKELPSAKHIIMTIHGVNTRLNLDEGESMLAQLAGLVDVMQAWQAPRDLEKITIVEFDKTRVRRIREALQDYFDEVHYAQVAEDVDWGYDLTFERETQIDAPDAGQEKIKPYAVALFPDKPDLEDIFYYGIQRPVHATGLLCERLNPDNQEDENDTLQAILDRIKTASVLICDVSEITSLLYLQLGYAWGRGIPTVLISRNENNQLSPDSTLHYEKIWQLEERLGQWLKSI